MKNRFFLAISAMLVTAGLLLSATAQIKGNLDKNPRVEAQPAFDGKISIGTQVKLECRVGTPVEFPTIYITNNTNQTVPSGKRVYWQANQYMKGSIVLSAPLAPGQVVTTSSEAKGTSYNPTAWYFK